MFPSFLFTELIFFLINTITSVCKYPVDIIFILNSWKNEYNDIHVLWYVYYGQLIHEEYMFSVHIS